MPFHTAHRAMQWYKKAADKGDKRAMQRLKGAPNKPVIQPGGHGQVLRRSKDGESDSGSGGKNKDKDCIIM